MKLTGKTEVEFLVGKNVTYPSTMNTSQLQYAIESRLTVMT